jgi:hypothetical protein
MFFILVNVILGLIIVDSGSPSANLATGTTIYKFQTAAVQFQAPSNIKFKSASILLLTDLVEPPNNQITIQLCKDNISVPDLENCLETHIETLEPAKRYNLTWSSVLKNLLLENSKYWIVVSGNSPIVETSFTWLDASTFKAVTASLIDEKWIVDSDNNEASTIKVEGSLEIKY